MNVDTMRKIDYYIGVPLCFIATLIRPLLSLGQRAQPASPKKVLFIELSEMGSAILVDPAMRRLQEAGCEVFFVIFKKNKVSLDILNTVSNRNIFTIRENNFLLLIWDTFRFLIWCRRQKIDSLIDLELFSRFTALLTAFSGCSRRVGFYRFHNEGVYRGEHLTHKAAYNPHLHIAKNFMSLAYALMSPKTEVPFSKTVISDFDVQLQKATPKRASIDRVKATISDLNPQILRHPIVLINANASDMLPQRRWPYSHFSQLIKLIFSQFPQVHVLLTGSPEEKQTLEKIREEVNDSRCYNFAGKVSFGDLTALYTLAAIMVSNDSGPPHFASVTRLRTYALFGPETPHLYGSLGNFKAITANLACSPCVSAWNHRKTACTDNQCLKQITPEQVFGEIRAELECAMSQSNNHLELV